MGCTVEFSCQMFFFHCLNIIRSISTWTTLYNEGKRCWMNIVRNFWQETLKGSAVGNRRAGRAMLELENDATVIKLF